jgi:hypothetical protein
MARKSKQDLAKAKEAKQKKILIVGSVLLVAIGAIQIPRTMKMLNQKPKPPVAAPTSTTTDPNAAPADPNSLAAPTLAGAPPTASTTPAAPATSSASLVSAVPVSADPGQLQTFERFATKDPFAQQTPSTGSSSGGGSSSSSGGGGGTSTGGGSVSVTTTSAPPPASAGSGSGSTPSAPALTSAVISVNGELGSATVGADFPTSGTVFSRVGSIFHLVSATAKTAKIAIAGGSYANGAQTIPLTVGKPVTLQNTADGTKYTLILEPQGTSATPGSTTAVTTTPTSTTPVVPSSGNGG